MKLQKFEFRINGLINVFVPRGDPMFKEHDQLYRYDFSCETLKDLTLAQITAEHEMGLRYLLRKCKALENLYLHYVLAQLQQP
jgi:F-box and leucine-rich repeat protein 2/20